MHLLDVRGLLGPKVKKLRFVSEDTWFPSSRDVGVDCRFYTLLQESFNTAYRQLDVRISEHRRLHWGALRVAPGGVPILPFFERFTGLPSLLSERAAGSYCRAAQIWSPPALGCVDPAAAGPALRGSGHRRHGSGRRRPCLVRIRSSPAWIRPSQALACTLWRRGACQRSTPTALATPTCGYSGGRGARGRPRW